MEHKIIFSCYLKRVSCHVLCVCVPIFSQVILIAFLCSVEFRFYCVLLYLYVFAYGMSLSRQCFDLKLRCPYTILVFNQTIQSDVMIIIFKSMDKFKFEKNEKLLASLMDTLRSPMMMNIGTLRNVNDDVGVVDKMWVSRNIIE